jgi:hypothetical protein
MHLNFLDPEMKVRNFQSICVNASNTSLLTAHESVEQIA